MRRQNFRQRAFQVLDPGLDLGIQVLARRVDGVQVQFLGAVLGQHAHQRAVAQAFDGGVHRQHADAHAAGDRSFHRVGRVDQKRRRIDQHHFLTFRAFEHPFVQGNHRADQAQAGMVEQVTGLGGGAVGFYIGRRCTDDAVGDAQALGHKTRVRQFAGQHDGHVVALVEQVRHAVGQGQVEGHIRVGLAVAGNGVDHEVLADAGHGVHFQLSGGARVGVAGLGFGFFDIGQDLLAAQQIAFAGFGQGNAASGAVQQACLQVGLKVGDRARDVGRGGVQHGGSGRETSGFGHTTEGAHVLQSVHEVLSRGDIGDSNQLHSNKL